MRERLASCVLPLAAVAAARMALALAGVAAIGCEVPTRPNGTRLAATPAVFAVWWQEVERCAGVSGDLDRISWYVVPCEPGETGFRCEATPEGLCAGEWRKPHTIELAGPNRILPEGYVSDEWTVKHEMLHDLLGTPEHTTQFWNCQVALR